MVFFWKSQCEWQCEKLMRCVHWLRKIFSFRERIIF